MVQTAKVYRSTVTYGELRDYIFEKTGITHDGLLPNWIGKLLARIVAYCERENIPQLSALVTKDDGTVGDGYRLVVGDYTLAGRARSLDELDDHAADTRLECYRHFGADLPPGGGTPSLTRRAQVAREKRNDSTPRRESAQCPTCFVTLPATGRCDDCD